MSHRSRVVVFLMAGLAAALASACGDDGDDGDDGGNSGAGAGGTGSGSAGASGKGGSSASNGGASGSGISGKGGTAGTAGNADSGGAAGKGGGGGTAGTRDCEIVQCFRPVDCVEECGGPVLKSSCCPCDEGTFDNFECDGSGGSGARRGSGGASNEAGAGGASAGFDLSDLNSSCVDGACPDGLTPIHYYGLGGSSGPRFCSCSIPCDEDPNACPDGTSCATFCDGPGTVCST